MTRATTIGDFNPHASPTTPTRPTAYCPCGTRLSRYRPPCTTLCWNCERRQLHATPPEILHPRPRGDGYAPCPSCGGQMHHKAQTCRACRVGAG